MKNNDYIKTAKTHAELDTQSKSLDTLTLNWKYLDKSYVTSVVKRRINVLSYSVEAYRELASRPSVINFFKRNHVWQENAEMHRIVEKHPGYNRKFFDAIINKLKTSRKQFMENVSKAKGNMSEEFAFNVTAEEHSDAIKYIHSHYYGNRSTAYRPSSDRC